MQVVGSALILSKLLTSCQTIGSARLQCQDHAKKGCNGEDNLINTDRVGICARDHARHLLHNMHKARFTTSMDLCVCNQG